MIPYFISFIFSALTCLCGEKNLKRKNYKLANSAFFISFLILSILAGVRDYGVGTDISFYGNPMFYHAEELKSLPDFYNEHEEIEPLYKLLVYFTSVITDEPHLLYFFTGILIYGFMLGGIIRFSKYFSVSISLTWIYYMLLFYGNSLNLMRQSIAMSIAFWGFSFVLKKQNVKFLISLFFACSFHITGIVFIFIFFIYKILEAKNTIFVRSAIIVSFLVITLFYNSILLLGINLGVLNSKFLRYTSIGYAISINPIIIRIPFIIIICIIISKFAKEKLNININKRIEVIFNNKLIGYFLLIMVIADMMFAPMRAILVTLYRVSLFFAIFKPVAYSRIVKSFKGNHRIVASIIIIFYLVVLWVYQNVIQLNDEIYPYTSSLIGIS